MQARALDEDGIHILQLEGEIDLETSPDLRELLGAQIEAGRSRLLIDFSGVTYIDSSGLATLVEYVQKAMKFGGHLALAGISERLRTVFDLARLGEIFAIYTSVPEAKDALAKAA